MVVVNSVTGSILLHLKLHPTPKAVEGLRSQLEAIVQRQLRHVPRHRRAAAGSPARRRHDQASTSDVGPPWHELPGEAVAHILNSSTVDGLSQTEAHARLRELGPNVMPQAVARSSLERLARQLWTLPTGLLSASAALSWVLGDRTDAALIGAVITANTGIGYAMETQSERVIDSLGLEEPVSVEVWRNGRLQSIAAADLVVGDLVQIKAGPVAADLRLLQTTELSVDESALTGESAAVVKDPAPLQSATRLAERKNLLFCGTTVLGGSGKGLVVATGGATEAGRIHLLVGRVRPPATPLQRRLDDLGVSLVWLSGGICAGIMLLGIWRGLGVLRMLRTSISLAVAALPEGLPTVGTLTLALGVKQLRRDDVFVRELAAVENLGAVNELCFDKTGTITLNRLSVAAITSGLRTFSIERRRLVDEESRPVAVDADLSRLMLISLLCNDAAYGPGSSTGSATEAALLPFAHFLKISPQALNSRYPRVTSRYRSASSRYMATSHRQPDGTMLLAVKGAPEDILSFCQWLLIDGEEQPLTPAIRDWLLERNEQFAKRALRVLGTAFKIATEADAISAESGLVWLGLIGLHDELRPGVKDMIEDFHRAGIQASMITGDQEHTAQALVEELGLNHQSRRLRVYSRVSPADKLKIVQDLQAAGRIVAMTGDGVNDSPALRAADVGIAMGSGTGVAREAAQVVLGSNDLATLFAAVRRGRTIRDNLGKALHFLLATNLSEILVLFGGVAAGRGDLLSPRQLLWINLLTDVLPALALAFEPPEASTMTRPPRDPDGRLYDPAEWRAIGWEACCLAGGALLVQLSTGPQEPRRLLRSSGERTATMTFFALSLAQLLHTSSARSQYSSAAGAEPRAANRYVAYGMASGAILQLATLFLPSLRLLLGNAKLSVGDGVKASLGAVVPYALIESMKVLKPTWLQPATRI